MKRKIVCVKRRNINEIEAIAKRRLERFQPEALTTPQAVDIDRYLNFHLGDIYGFDFDYKAVGPEVLGWTDFADNQIVISAELSDSDLLVDKRRYRSTVAHEIGHVELHRDDMRQASENGWRSTSKNANSDSRLFYERDLKPIENPEWQGWWWAKAFLMPLPAVKQLLYRGTDQNTMAEIFDVNRAFMRVRLNDLIRNKKV